MDIVTKQFIDNMEVTDGTMVSWEEMWFGIGFVDQIWMLADSYNVVPRDHSYVPLLHTLNKTNIDDKLMVRLVSTLIIFIYSRYLCTLLTVFKLCFPARLPQRVVPKEMGANHELPIVLHPRVNISSTAYSASGEGDGSIIFNGWSKVGNVYDMYMET